MKLKLLSPMVTEKESLPVGAEIDYPIGEAVEMVDRGIAKPLNQQEYLDAKEEIKKQAIADEETKARAIASIQQDKLKESVEYLKAELDSTLELIDDEKFKAEFDSTRMIGNQDIYIQSLEGQIENIGQIEKKYVKLVLKISNILTLKELKALKAELKKEYKKE